jgi:hypothetical protein
MSSKVDRQIRLGSSKVELIGIWPTVLWLSTVSEMRSCNRVRLEKKNPRLSENIGSIAVINAGCLTVHIRRSSDKYKEEAEVFPPKSPANNLITGHAPRDR